MGIPLNHPSLKQARAKGLIVGEAAAAVPAADPIDVRLLVAAVVAAGHPEPLPEHEFAPPRKWRFDLCWPDSRVAFEREGGRFQPVRCRCGEVRTVFVSRHHSRDGLEQDAEKYNAAAAMGWVLVRATPGMIRDGRALVALLAAFQTRGA